MKKIFFFFMASIFSGQLMAAEVFSIDKSASIDEQMQRNCPWIDFSQIQKVVVIQPEKIGWSGGEGGKVLGDLFEETGLDINYSLLKGNLPDRAKAILLETQYYTNEGSAEIIVNELTVTQFNGDKISLWLDDTQRILSQAEGETLIVCFEEDEQIVRVSIKATHQSVDGTRPTLGLSAFTTLP